jgi:tetratricopeptide (TPR) repeat protein
MHPAGFYQSGPEKNYVALRLDVSLNQEAYEPFEPVYHEYVHYLMRRLISQIPLWLTEGLAEFYGNTRLESKTVFVGAPSGTNLMILQQKQLVPLSVLFAVDATSPYYHEDNKASIFYAESWALTHYLMTRDWRDKTHRLNDFVALLGKNVAPDEAAKRTIGDPQQLDVVLAAYVRQLAFTAAAFAPPSDVNEESFVPEPISDAESLAIRADFLVHTRRYTDAREMLEESLKADPKLAVACESMGLLYALQNQTDEANKWYSQAIALNSQSFFANYYYATNLLKGRLSDDLAVKAESSLRTAISVNPGFAPSYDALAYLLETRHRDLEEPRMLTLHAISLEPGNVSYRLRMATLLVQMDRADDALHVAEFAASMAKTPADLAQARDMVSYVQKYQESKRRSQEEHEAFKKSQGAVVGGTMDGSMTADTRSPGANSCPDPTQPPVLRHRENAMVPRPVKVTPAGEPLVSSPRPELLTQSEAADGVITEVDCPSGATLELTVASPSGMRHLYTDNYFKVSYRALNYTPQGALNPCVDLRGRHGHVIYHPAKVHPEQGQIVEVQLTK